jgi:digeranylgeranylglycerophospholipid reductase
MFDVIVVGGNLAGASAAINASKLGVSVALIEKNKEPIFPPRCGEATDSVTTEILKLDEIGCQKNEINQITVNISSKKEYKFSAKKNKIYIIDRNFLEKHLLKSAKQKGVETKQGASMKKFQSPNKITLDTGEILNGKVIIDATGVRCQIGKQIGLNTKLKPKDVGVCIQSRVLCDIKPDNMKMWFNRPYAPLGYAWIFPKNKNEANIGIGISGGQKEDLTKLLKRYITNELEGEVNITSTFRSCVPKSKPLDPLVKDNVMFIGDAARLTNAIFENGINLAVFSGTVAGKIAGKYIEGKIPSLNYYTELMRTKVKRLTKAYKFINKLKTEDEFEKTFRRCFSLLNLAHKISPNLLENQLTSVVKKDKKIIDSLE